ncbi:MAG: GFA family protein [Brevundimonas sp.]
MTKAGVAAVMQVNPKLLSGGCACGAVRFRTWSEPLRIGLCHCMACRKAHAAAFNPFIVFKAEAVEVIGKPRSWFSSSSYDRQFCGNCGSRVIAFNGDEVEISLGSLDEPGLLEPQYETWVIRREPWLCALDKPQHTVERAT